MWWHVNKGLLIGAVHKRGEALLLHTSFWNIFLLFPPVELREPQGNICSVFQNSTCLWCVTKAQDWSWLRRIFLSAKCGPWLFLVQVEVHPNRSSWKIYIYIKKCVMFIRKQRSKADSLLWLMMSSWKPQDKFNEHSISSKCWNSTWRRLFTHSHVLRPVLKYSPQYETTEKLCAYLAPTERRWLWSVQH